LKLLHFRSGDLLGVLGVNQVKEWEHVKKVGRYDFSLRRWSGVNVVRRFGAIERRRYVCLSDGLQFLPVMPIVLKYI
jgi:hypothetical protein